MFTQVQDFFNYCVDCQQLKTPLVFPIGLSQKIKPVNVCAASPEAQHTQPHTALIPSSSSIFLAKTFSCFFSLRTVLSCFSSCSIKSYRIRWREKVELPRPPLDRHKIDIREPEMLVRTWEEPSTAERWCHHLAEICKAVHCLESKQDIKVGLKCMQHDIHRRVLQVQFKNTDRSMPEFLVASFHRGWEILNSLANIHLWLK